MQLHTQPPPKHRDAGYALERHCPRCDDYWPADAEFFHPRPNGRLDSWCRACSNESRNQKRKAKA